MKRILTSILFLISFFSFIQAQDPIQLPSHSRQSQEREMAIKIAKSMNDEAAKPDFNPAEFEKTVLKANDMFIESNMLTASGIILHQALNIMNNLGYTNPEKYNMYRLLIAVAEFYLRGGDLAQSAEILQTTLKLFALTNGEDSDSWMHNHYILTTLLAEDGGIDRALGLLRDGVPFLKGIENGVFTTPTINAMLYCALALEPHLTSSDITDIIAIVKKRNVPSSTGALFNILLAKYAIREFKSYEKALEQLETVFENEPTIAYSLALPDALEAAWNVNKEKYIDMLSEALFYHQDDIVNHMSAFSINSSEMAWDKKARRFNRAHNLGLNTYPDNHILLTGAWLNSVFYKSLSLQNIHDMWKEIRKGKNKEAKKLLSDLISKRQQMASTTDAELRKELAMEADNLEWMLRAGQGLSNPITKNHNKAVMAYQQLDPDECEVEIFEYPYFDKEAGEMSHFGAIICTAKEKFEKNFGINLKHEHYEFVDLGPILAWDMVTNGLYGQFDAKQKAEQYSPSNILNVGNLFKPLIEKIKGYRRAYISPANTMNSINIGAVPVGMKGEILNDLVEIVRINSAYELEDIKKRGASLNSGTVFANINFTSSSKDKLKEESETKGYRVSVEKGGNLKRFYNLPIDADALSNAIPIKGKRLQFLSEADASEEQFKDLDGKATELIHLDSHGFYIPESDNIYLGKHLLEGTRERVLLTCGLALAGANRAWQGEEVEAGKEDGILTAWEISCMDLSKCKLAVLSACETAAGENDPINGVLGLQRALKIAGVKSMLLTLWPVDNELTQEFINSFYSRLPHAKDFNQAFVETQREFRRRHPDPYIWAPFILIN